KMKKTKEMVTRWKVLSKPALHALSLELVAVREYLQYRSQILKRIRLIALRREKPRQRSLQRKLVRGRERLMMMVMMTMILMATTTTHTRRLLSCLDRLNSVKIVEPDSLSLPTLNLLRTAVCCAMRVQRRALQRQLRRRQLLGEGTRR